MLSQLFLLYWLVLAYQKKQILLLASNYTSIITSSHVLDDYNFTARIIPRQVTFGNTKEYPNISISDNNLIVEINGFEKKGTSNFGTGLDVEIENGIVVIKNAP